MKAHLALPLATCFGLTMIFATLLFLTGSTHAQIYRWVDKDGKVHFSDEKPTEGNVDTVIPDIADPADEPDEGELRRRSYLESANDPRFSPTPQARPNSANDLNDSRCRRSRVEYAMLEEPVPVYRTATGEMRAHWINDTHQGSRQYIEDADRESEQDAAWDRMNRYCADASNQDAYIQAWNDYVDDVYCSEHEVKLEQARERRSRTPRDQLIQMEREFNAKCG